MKAVFLDNLTRRERKILLLTALIGALALIYILIAEPLIAGFRGLNDEISSKSRKLKKIYSLLGHKERIEAEYDKLIKSTVKDASDEEMVAGILNQIETLARASGVQLNNVRPEKIREEEYYKRLSTEVSIEASTTDALFKFIYGLETSPSLLKIERLQITPSRKQESSVESTFIVTKISFQ